MKTIISIFATVLFVVITNAEEVVFDWVKQLGGTSTEISYSIALDDAGNIYTTGWFSGTVDFDPGASTYNLTTANSDIFISKLDTSGDFIWAKQIGGSGFNTGFFISLENTNDIYITGLSRTADFDPGAGNFNLTSAGSSDTFILKLDVSGNFVWAKQFVGTSSFGQSLALDNSGNVYATGYFSGTVDFDPGTGASTSTSGSSDIFITKFDVSGNFVWAKRIGGTNTDRATDIKIDDSGTNIYSTGEFQGTVDFDPNGGIFNLTSSGSRDVYLSKLDASGNLVWALKLGDVGADRGHSIILDNLNSYLYVAGEYSGTVDFDPGTGINNLTSAGGQDTFITKLDMLGNFVWAKGMGGSGPEEPANSIQLDASSDVIVAGWFTGTSDFDPGAGIFNLTSSGENDAYIAKLDNLGNFVWAINIGGTSYDDAWSIAIDSFDNIYTTGSFSETVVYFDPGSGTFNLTYAGGDGDIYIHKMGPDNLGISEINFWEHLKIYPNPNNGILNINGETNNITNIEIYSITGQKVMVVLDNFSEINIGELKSAIYFVKLYSEEGVGTVKIIKE